MPFRGGRTRHRTAEITKIILKAGASWRYCEARRIPRSAQLNSRNVSAMSRRVVACDKWSCRWSPRTQSLSGCSAAPSRITRVTATKARAKGAVFLRRSRRLLGFLWWPITSTSKRSVDELGVLSEWEELDRR
jgi:hypothetical protein